MNAPSLALQAYAAALDRLEAERRAALNAPGADPERLNIAMLRRMSTALIELRAAQLAESRRGFSTPARDTKPTFENPADDQFNHQ
jgi:hypothetical protein